VYGGYIGALIGKLMDAKAEIVTNEVLYVGQAFGKGGERTAFDRLKSHSTLQRIYAENRPDFDIWLTLCDIPDVTLLQDIDPKVSAEVTGDDDLAHATDVIKRAHDPRFVYRGALTMAEAGLIRYFMPHYNVMYKNSYPDSEHVHLSEAYGLDLVELIVEFHGFSVSMSYGTERQPPSPFHLARFPLREAGGLVALLMEDVSRLPPGTDSEPLVHRPDTPAGE
jgi:hypothetical protein